MSERGEQANSATKCILIGGSVAAILGFCAYSWMSSDRWRTRGLFPELMESVKHYFKSQSPNTSSSRSSPPTASSPIHSPSNDSNRICSPSLKENRSISLTPGPALDESQIHSISPSQPTRTHRLSSTVDMDCVASLDSVASTSSLLGKSYDSQRGRQAIKDIQESISKDRKKAAVRLAKEAAENHRLANYEAAFSLFSKALTFHPHYKYYTNRALIGGMHFKRYELACQDASASLALKPTPKGYYVLGRCLMGLSRFEEALTNLDKVLAFSESEAGGSMKQALKLIAECKIKLKVPVEHVGGMASPRSYLSDSSASPHSATRVLNYNGGSETEPSPADSFYESGILVAKPDDENQP